MKMNKNMTSPVQNGNSKTVLHHLERLEARRTTYMGLGTIVGLICGLVLGCVFVFMLDLNQRWIALGPIGMVFGSFAGSLAGRIRQNDLAEITAELKFPPDLSNEKITAANNILHPIAASRGNE
jgi:hypothetical protein